MTLTRNKLEKFNPCQKSINDGRKRVAKAVFSYIDSNGIEYRKGFEAPANSHENVFWAIAPETIST